MDRGVSVVVTENHRNRAASSGWMMRLVRFGISDYSGDTISPTKLSHDILLSELIADG